MQEVNQTSPNEQHKNIPRIRPMIDRVQLSFTTSSHETDKACSLVPSQHRANPDCLLKTESGLVSQPHSTLLKTVSYGDC